jgi:hypothetical protein
MLPLPLIVTFTEGDLAEIQILGLGHVCVNGTDRVIHPVSHHCSQHFLNAMWRGGVVPLVRTMDAVEKLASELFPEDDLPWLWGLHEIKGVPPSLVN